MAKIPPSERNRELLKQTVSGTFCIAAFADKEYEWYAPLFLNRAKASYPEYFSVVFVRKGDHEIDLDEGIVEVDLDYPKNPYTSAALRFVEFEEYLREFDFVLLTDIDILIRREDPCLLNQHVKSLKKNNMG